MKTVFIFLITTLISQGTYAYVNKLDEEWTSVSAPDIMSTTLIHQFDLLPLSGNAQKGQNFWSGDYWAFRNGSINYRWNDPSKEGFNLNSPSREEAANMSLDQLARLSPSEKYDLFTGRYHYPLKAFVDEKGDPGAESWEGICHGWAPSSLNHSEPTPKNMVNPDGIVIPFGSSDIKALLSYYYAFEFKVADTHQMGRRCERGGFWGWSNDCKQDLNAGAFHIVLANKIGIEGTGFMADLDRYKEVWNHPVYAYETVVTGTRKAKRDSAPGTVSVVLVETSVHYVDEAPSTWDTVIGTEGQRVLTKEFEYDLDIDANGKIIGGEWHSRQRPDFLWTYEKALIWVGQFDRLNELLND
ncbi:MAG TPA: hypothetical protein VNJ08_10955 [Bacteriovoracaceae bacterium]|nr:hypothetical protein [Bacteriovoracaceae bacterium]